MMQIVYIATDTRLILLNELYKANKIDSIVIIVILSGCTFI